MFELDVLKWRCGNSRYPDSQSLGSGQTLFYDAAYDAHHMCVIGQMLQQAGARLEDLNRMANPANYREYLITTGRESELAAIPVLRMLLDLLTADNDAPPPCCPFRCTALAECLIEINDDARQNRTIFRRIQDLRFVLHQAGVQLAVKNYRY